MANVGAKASNKLLMLACLLVFMSICHTSHGEELELLLSFKASIDDPLHFLSNWVDHSVSICTWYGITCDDSSCVNSIELSGINITARKISVSIFNLKHVRKIDLSNNQLAGEISLDHSLSTSQLRFLNLSNNNFTGSLPNSLFSLSFSQLETLDLSNNMFSGKIPEQVGLLSNLRYLDLGGNVFVGKIPKSMTHLTSLQHLTLASNQLGGEIPRDIGLMKNLNWIYLGYNNLTGEIPDAIGELLLLNHLDLVYNNLTGKVPKTLGNLSNLQYLFLYQNKLSGPLPGSIFELRKLVSLDLSYNSLSGEIPELLLQLQSLEILHLFSNNFTGKIPKAIAYLPRLQVVQIWSNRLIGGIPKELGKRSNLTVLDLSTNNLSGNIPDSLCNSGSLFKLILFSNFFQGDIPKSLNTCRSLRRVRLQNNRLSGPLSHELTKLPMVYFFDVSGNKLSGNINDRKWDMPSIQMLNLANNHFSGELPDSFGSNKIENIDLSDNQFSGKIPTNFGQFAELMQLTLRNNKLSGDIPSELSSCKKLVSLDLSHNHLSGQIPESLAEMPVLGLLDLSENELSGEIPQNLGRIASLVQVNVSHNHFRGRLPSTGAFLAINMSAITGNNLCDETGTGANGLPPCKRVNNSTWWFVLACLLVSMAVFLLASLLIVNVRRRKEMELRRVETEDKIWELQFLNSKAAKSMSISDILLSRKEENVICRGKSEVSYKGKCVVNGMQFVVREIINHSTSVSVNLWPEIVEFCNVTRHPNIVNLMGTCQSGKEGFLIYEYCCPEKNLSDIVGCLSWGRRRKVLLGIAKALRFLHIQCSPSVVVGEMSPDRVLVDKKYEPRLWLSPPGMFCTDSKSFISSGYVAPEVKNPKDVTEQSDIYGFGLLLIELLTGKKPSDMEFGLHQNIVEWARYCYSDCHIDMWIDTIIRDHHESNAHRNEIVETMNLALHCTAGDPTVRPDAADVLKTVISITRGSRCHPSVLTQPFK